MSSRPCSIFDSTIVVVAVVVVVVVVDREECD